MLSIDILLGVLSSYLFAGTLLNSNEPPLIPLILCLSVWLVYTLDHLADASWLGGNSKKPVYIWHLRYRRVLFNIAIFTAVIGGVISFVFLPSRVIFTGIVCGLLLVLYLLLNSLRIFRKRYFFKEVWIAILYAGGIWIFPYFFRLIDPDYKIFLVFSAFFCLVLVNVLSYSFFELPVDLLQGLKTFGVVFGGRACRLLIIVLLIISFSLSLVLIFVSFSVAALSSASSAGILLLAMTLIMAMIHLFPDFFGKNERFGIVADGVFILPAGIFLF